MKVFFCIGLFFTTLFYAGCKKGNAEEESNCPNINNARITSNSPLTIDQDLTFSVPEVGGYRIYDWRGPNNFTSQYPDNSITGVELKHEGWYRLHLYSLDGDCEKFDSLYVDVKLKQGSPSCNITSNTTNYNNLGTDSYTLVRKQIETSSSQKALLATGTGGANLSVIFHTRWRTAEPEDGIYVTSNTPLFGQTDNNYNKVFITTTKSSIYWASAPDQTVYVSHVGTKLQVRFCNLSMGGSNGTSFTTIASGNIVEQ
jgi:hypothetical protein